MHTQGPFVLPYQFCNIILKPVQFLSSVSDLDTFNTFVSPGTSSFKTLTIGRKKTILFVGTRGKVLGLNLSMYCSIVIHRIFNGCVRYKYACASSDSYTSIKSILQQKFNLINRGQTFVLSLLRLAIPHSIAHW